MPQTYIPTNKKHTKVHFYIEIKVTTNIWIEKILRNFKNKLSLKLLNMF